MKTLVFAWIRPLPKNNDYGEKGENMKGGLINNALLIKALKEKKERQEKKAINLTHKECPNPWRWMRDFWR